MQYFTFLCHRFSPTLSCLQRRPLAARFISQGPSILLGITVPSLKEKNGMFSFLPFLMALICREEARYDQHEQHRTRRSPKIFQPIGVKHWRSFSQLEWNVKCDFEQNLINCFVYAKMYLQRASDKISRAQMVCIYNGWTPGPQKNRQQGALCASQTTTPAPSIGKVQNCGALAGHDQRKKMTFPTKNNMQLE